MTATGERVAQVTRPNDPPLLRQSFGQLTLDTIPLDGVRRRPDVNQPRWANALPAGPRAVRDLLGAGNGKVRASLDRYLYPRRDSSHDRPLKCQLDLREGRRRRVWPLDQCQTKGRVHL